MAGELEEMSGTIYTLLGAVKLQGFYYIRIAEAENCTGVAGASRSGPRLHPLGRQREWTWLAQHYTLNVAEHGSSR